MHVPGPGGSQHFGKVCILGFVFGAALDMNLTWVLSPKRVCLAEISGNSRNLTITSVSCADAAFMLINDNHRLSHLDGRAGYLLECFPLR